MNSLDYLFGNKKVWCHFGNDNYHVTGRSKTSRCNFDLWLCHYDIFTLNLSGTTGTCSWNCYYSFWTTYSLCAMLQARKLPCFNVYQLQRLIIKYLRNSCLNKAYNCLPISTFLNKQKLFFSILIFYFFVIEQIIG